MKRRTSALSVTAAALLAATAAPLLTGCSTDAHPGAAAVVGDERITVASVQAQVEAVRDAQRELPEGDQLIAASGALTRDTVANLVQLRLLEAAAEEAGVSVSRRDVQEERERSERAVGGAEALERAALTPQVGIPMAGDEQIDQTIRGQLLYQRLAQRIGATTRQDMAAALAETAEEIGVDVNPRYGDWDSEISWLSDEPAPWLREADAGDEGPGQPVTLDG
ncbi:SurA N-terminal domain-containing protein [Streptomyces sp. DSM 44917]|uniref:SurA N-terminal domain-containing protein n=1 Tax=Streptomyces boetiae TaxID=3075541 RepID=A0ABU2LFY3_9ACTN|nr:SurA N-terminal domain-containing protein [Streptomyces sp. DSM 44917]MDT0310499.1 SurA N-terminal domain-containing protein [Streptomyces sp. DSM 44917]